MKRLILVCLAAMAFLVPAIATAEICTIDNVPAATLLLPYFEVDLDSPTGVNTVISINNASASALLAHVVIWTDLSVPTLDFDIYLTGFDVQTMSMRDVFNGIFPVTADDGADTGDTSNPNDGISNQGIMSQDINFPGASGACADPIRNPIASVYLSHLRNAHTGRLSAIFGACAGQNLGDNIARGYITIDSVTQCSLLFPGDATYFSSGTVDHRNILWGDWVITDQARGIAYADAMVAIESAAGGSFFGTVNTPFPSGAYTFYGRYVSATAVDQREPLPTSHMVRFLNGPAGTSDFLVWRDAKVNQGPFPCGTTPAWYPLPANDVVFFDEQENPELAAGCAISPCFAGAELFPAEAQRVPLSELTLTSESGFAFLNLNTTSTSGLFNGFAQSWVVGVQESDSMATATAATALDSACAPRNQILIP